MKPAGTWKFQQGRQGVTMSERIKAYFLRVDEETGKPYQGYIGYVENTLEAKQKYVNFDRPGGTIQVFSIGKGIALICEDSGKLKDFPVNRAWVRDGKVIDLLVGNVLIVRYAGEDFVSIREGDIEYVERFLVPAKLLQGEVVLLKNESLPEYKGR